MVFIGIELKEHEVREKLESCLCTSDEIRDLQDGFFTSKDPFPLPRNTSEVSPNVKLKDF